MGIKKKVESILKRKAFGKNFEKEKEAKIIKRLNDFFEKRNSIYYR
jgi:hypothetical protein